MTFAPPIFANLLLALAAIGYGSLLRPLFPLEFSRLDRAAVTLLGGLGLVGTAFFVIGQFWYTKPLLIGILAIGAGIFFFAYWRELQPRRVRISVPQPALVAAIAIGCVLAITALGGLVRPVGDLGDDAIAYHFLGPKVWLRDGAIRPVPEQPCTAFPAIVESSYGGLMAIGKQRSPNLFAVTGLLALLLAAAALAERISGSPSAAWWTAALIATMPAVYRGAYGGFIDAIYAAFVLCAARVAFDARRLSDFVLAGIFCGFAMATKYTGILAAAALVAVMVPLIWQTPGLDFKVTVRRLALAGTAALAIALPVYVRNWLVLGSPIYPPTPGLLRFFSVKYMSRSAVEGFYHYIRIRGLGMGRSLTAFVLLPFHLTYHTSLFNGAGGIGLAPLGLVPFGLIAARRVRFARALAAFALLLTVAWFLTEQESRFLIDVYAILAVLAAIGMPYVARREPRVGPLLTAIVLACSLGYGLFMIGRARADDLHAVFSKSYAAQREWKDVPYLASFNYINGKKDVTKVLILRASVPGFYSDKDYIQPIGAFGAQSLADPQKVIESTGALAALHVSHILDVRDGARRFEVPAHLANLTLVFEQPDQRIYAVDYGHAQRPSTPQQKP
jgi:Dolichyl-phosphate-mannose-protein mannosyltransferase